MKSALATARRLLRPLATRPRPAILMYHRIAEPRFDPWGLAVSPACFAGQLEALMTRRTPLSMEDFVARLDRGTLPGDAVALTFDDGYLDNALVAKPMLEAAGVPATFFLTTGNIRTADPFWWDELAEIVLGCEGPAKGTLDIAGVTIPVSLKAFDEAEATSAGWRVSAGARTVRETLFVSLWSALQLVPEEEREACLAPIRALLGARRPDAADCPMDVALARRLRSDVIAIGAHARHHHPLTTYAAERMPIELAAARDDLSDLLDIVPTGIAYPHGDRNAQVIAETRRAGFQWACSTVWRTVDPLAYDLFDLPRICVADWSGRQLLDQMRGRRSFR